ncbi:MAG: response regulator [Hyphomicrobiales bacterium]|nr:response regulator [Hyphomicrobiales bacterium]
MTGGQSNPTSRIRPPHLTKRFLILGALVLLGAVVLLIEVDHRTAESDLKHWAEANNIGLTTAIANSIWPRYADHIATARNQAIETLRGSPQTDRLLEDVRNLVEGLNILKVKLYDLKGLTVFSTQPDQIGSDYSGKDRFIKSVAGDVVSILGLRDNFQAIQGPVTQRWVLASYVPVRQGGNNSPILGVAEIYTDVTSQRHAAHGILLMRAIIIGAVLLVMFTALAAIVWKSDVQLARHHKREVTLKASAAEAIVRTEAKSKFLAQMSHELRTPMNGVLGLVNLLSKTNLDARQQQFLASIQQSGEALLALIDGILDFSRIEAGKLTLNLSRFNIVDCVQEVADLLSPSAAEKGLEFVCLTYVDSRQTGLGDEQRLSQVLINLVSNAITFTEKGQVTLLSEVVEQVDDTVRIRFAVRDTGIGISKDRQEQIFEPFYQIDNPNARHIGGSGLGLSISNDLVQIMGGKIQCFSEEGRGSTFCFDLLFEDAEIVELPMDEGAAAAERSSADRRAQILIAEDNEINLLVAEEFLLSLGYTVDAVKDGAAAVSAWEAGTYALILMDIQMPRMDGLEVTRQIRIREQERGLAETPIIALTAHAFEEDREKCLAVGMNDYITKPFDQNILGRILSQYVNPTPHEASEVKYPQKSLSA